jgi:hypothetical protein
VADRLRSQADRAWRAGPALAAVFAVTLAHTTPARADLAAGVAAYERSDFSAAMTQLRPEADAGNARAQLLVGRMLEQGRGGPADPAGALAWYRRAAEQDLAEAQYRLAVLLQVGLAGTSDPVEAAVWLTIVQRDRGAVADAARAFAHSFAATLTPDQQASARTRANAWRPARPVATATTPPPAPVAALPPAVQPTPPVAAAPPPVTAQRTIPPAVEPPAIAAPAPAPPPPVAARPAPASPPAVAAAPPPPPAAATAAPQAPTVATPIPAPAAPPPVAAARAGAPSPVAPPAAVTAVPVPAPPPVIAAVPVEPTPPPASPPVPAPPSAPANIARPSGQTPQAAIARPNAPAPPAPAPVDGQTASVSVPGDTGRLIAQVFDNFRCADLRARPGQGGAVVISGVTRDDAEAARVANVTRAAIRNDNVQMETRALGDLCEAARAVGLRRGLPGKELRLTSVKTNAVFNDGENVVVQVTAPAPGGILYVDYYQLDGTVVHLEPQEGKAARRINAGQSLRLGDGAGGADAWTVSAPFGVEMISAIVVPMPLFAAPRPAAEPHRDYLRALEEALQKATAGAGWAAAEYVVIQTKAP